MIQATGVVKQYGSFRALDGLSLTVPKGSVYGLVGPNGAGKSTLIRCITGAFRPEQGEITLEGENVWENPRVKARMAHIPDEIFFYPQSNLTDLQRFYAGFYPGFDKELWGRLEPVFQLPRKTPLRRFSKGMQKQAAFWLALACRPEVLILDEPVDGLDPMMRRQVWQLLLGDVAQNGTTVLVSSHNLRELEDVCDHVGILSHGKVLLERSLTDLQDNIIKLQLAFQEPGLPPLPEGLNVLHTSQIGRVYTLIVRGDPAQIKERMAALNPILMEMLPLSLEEIFIYELGGEDYAVRNIVL